MDGNKQNTAVLGDFKECNGWHHINKMFECMGKEVDQKEIQINNVRRNVKILHRSDNWLKLAFLESLAIKEHIPPLNTGIKATKEFVLKHLQIYEH